MSPNNSFRFVRTFLLTALGVIGLIGLFNALIDPYGNLGFNRMGVYIGVERELKPYQIQHYPHDAVILGNSMQGVMDPDQIVSDYHFFNASIAGVQVEEIRTFLERYVQHDRLLLLALDFRAVAGLHTPYLDEPLPDSFQERVIEHIFNLHTIEYSFRTINRYRRKDLPTYKANGAAWGEVVQRLAQDRALSAVQYDALPQTANYYNRLTVDPRRIAELRKIRQILDDRKIPFVVFSNPLNEKVWETLKQSKSYPAYQSWLREMHEIFPDFVDLNPGPFTAESCYWKFDFAHYKPDVGLAIVDLLLKEHDPNKRRP